LRDEIIENTTIPTYLRGIKKDKKPFKINYGIRIYSSRTSTAIMGGVKP
jgi:hypothetical protein